jgi:tetratricopeptide (TPR) repeat protein
LLCLCGESFIRNRKGLAAVLRFARNCVRLLKFRPVVSVTEDSPVKSWKPFLLVAAGLLVGFAAGFALANAINRQEQEKLRAEVARLRSGGAGEEAAPRQGGSAGELTIPDLTGEQIRAAFERADASPRDAALQRTTGQALYLYAMQKGDASVLPEVARVLARALELDPRNEHLAVFAGNAHFRMAQHSGDRSHLKEARKFYEKALALKPDDPEVRTSLGLTHFFDEPSDPRRAAGEYRRALEVAPRSEPSLQALVAALVAAGELDEAERRLAELAAVNPQNPELPALRARLEQKRNAAKETQ